MLKKNISQSKAYISGMHKVINNKKIIQSTYQDEISDFKKLLADGYVDKQRLREHERGISSVDADIAELDTRIQQEEQKISESELRIAQIFKIFISESSSHLAEINAKFHEIHERWIVANDKLERTELRAPAKGHLIGMSVHTIGGVINPSEKLVEIVPKEEKLIVETRIAINDIDQIQIGKPAEIRFSAFNSRITPTIKAEVESISADKFDDAKTGQSYYLAKMKIDDKENSKLHGLTLLPGMPAEVFINLQDRTLFQYLMTPAKNVLSRAMIEE